MTKGKTNTFVHPKGHIIEAIGGKLVRQHRRVWREQRGPIPSGFDVHHRNGNPADNSIENLELQPHAEHARMHQLACNSFKGKRHTEEYKAKRSVKYSGAGNPRFLSHVDTEEIRQMRSDGWNWVQIGRALGINRGAAKRRIQVEG